VVGFARAGSTVFWKAHSPGFAPESVPETDEIAEPPVSERQPATPLVAVGMLLALIVSVTVLAGPIQRHLAATTAQLFAPEPYISVVLDTPGRQITYEGKSKDKEGGEEASSAAYGADKEEEAQ
jgi:multicomponent K+:H+ antiporter subunit D